MKRRLGIIVVAVIATMSLGLSASADNLGPCNGSGPGNSGYAQHHIVALAHDGDIGNGGHVPGTHRGFSLCLDVHS